VSELHYQPKLHNIFNTFIANIFTNKWDLNFRKELVQCYIWRIDFYGFRTWTLRKAQQKYLVNTEMWRWRRMEKISWTDSVRNEVLQISTQNKRRKANTIGHILRRNCLLKHAIKGKIEGRI
jgi:hypothetical protein